MEPEYYIASRFLRHENLEYYNNLDNREINEIVTMDSLLCKRRYLDLCKSEPQGSKIDTLSQIQGKACNDNEQIIKCVPAGSELCVKNDIGFDFCGYDVLDAFGENSWLTNYCLYNIGDKKGYTKYGLLASTYDVNRWIEFVKSTLSTFRDDEYKVFAVWRKLNSQHR